MINWLRTKIRRQESNSRVDDASLPKNHDAMSAVRNTPSPLGWGRYVTKLSQVAEICYVTSPAYLLQRECHREIVGENIEHSRIQPADLSKLFQTLSYTANTEVYLSKLTLESINQTIKK